MTSDPTYTPSPELVGAAGATVAGVVHPADDGTWVAGMCLSAAVAYRTPTGDPELVPWEQVRELVDALSEAIDLGETATRYWESEFAVGQDDFAEEWATWARISAALAPFTQEPQP